MGNIEEVYPPIGSLPFDRSIFDKILENRYGMTIKEIMDVPGASQEVEKMWKKFCEEKQ